MSNVIKKREMITATGGRNRGNVWVAFERGQEMKGESDQNQTGGTYGSFVQVGRNGLNVIEIILIKVKIKEICCITCFCEYACLAVSYIIFKAFLFYLLSKKE
ncbi:MAG: hypothetical protein ACOX19_09895 [Fermentimonas sp.]